jgi:hypothetical protein
MAAPLFFPKTAERPVASVPDLWGTSVLKIRGNSSGIPIELPGFRHMPPPACPAFLSLNK